MKRSLKVMAGLLAVLSHATTPARATDPGQEAYWERNYARALKIWQPAAAKGDPAAIYGMGLLYELGHGVEPSLSMAVTWYEKAVAAQNPSAAVRLALLHSDGRGVAQDDARATALYRMAARQGSLVGLFKTAEAYRDGRGVAVDRVLAYAYAAFNPRWHTKGVDLRDRVELAKNLWVTLTPEQQEEGNRLAFMQQIPETSVTGQQRK